MARSAKSETRLVPFGVTLGIVVAATPGWAAESGGSGGLPQLDLTTWPTQIF